MLIIKLYALVSLFIFVSTNALAEDGVNQIYCGQMLDVECGEIIAVSYTHLPLPTTPYV